MSHLETKSFPGSWIKIQKEGITMSSNFHHFFLPPLKVKIFYDAENQLLGLEPSEEGYNYSTRNGIRSRVIPADIPRKRFKAEWSEKHQMLIADLNDVIL